MYLSSLYGPVYLVSHIVTMYLMPELELIIALEPRGKSGFQSIAHPEYSPSDNSSACYHVVFANDDDAPWLVIVKAGDGWKMTIWTLHFHSFLFYNLSQLCINFVVLYFCPVLCVCVRSCRCVRKHMHLQYEMCWADGSFVLLFSWVLVLFSWILVKRLLHCVVLECLWNSWWTTEKYRWESVLLYKWRL